MSETVRLQDPAETLDHTLDWSAWLGTDTIATSVWAVIPTGPDFTTTPATHDATTATVWVKGVAFAKVYEVRNTIVSAAGRTGERSFTLRGFSE